MPDSIAQDYLENAIANFRQLKTLGEKALAQLDDEAVFTTLDPESNSIALIIKHLSGNMRSRWTEFLTADGEKPDRQRDAEFMLDPATTRAEAQHWWEAGWQCLFDALAELRPEDLARKVVIRGQAHTVVQAINRQLTHYAGHIGQIIFLAKHFKSTEWRSLSIPRGQSERVTQALPARPEDATEKP